MKNLLALVLVTLSASAALAESTLGDRTVEPQTSGVTRAPSKGHVLKPRADAVRFVSTEHNPLANVAVNSTRTRAEVQAEALKARAEGAQFVNNEHNPLADVALPSTRAQVRAEAAKANDVRAERARASEIYLPG